MVQSVIPISSEHQSTIANLSAAAHKKPMNINDVIEWEHGVDKIRLPKPKEQCWLFGTEFYQQLSDAQRSEVLWLENARDISMFMWLEQTIPPLYMGYINNHYHAISDEIREFLMVFSKEEIIHTLVFKKYMTLAELPMFEPPEGLQDLLTKVLPDMAPPIGIICTMLIEWMAEEAAQYAVKNTSIDLLTRQLYHAHHVDELRHIAFGRWVAEDYMKTLSAAEFQNLQGLVLAVLQRMLAQFTFNPAIADHCSFKYPIPKDDENIIEHIRNSENNKQLNQYRFASIFQWLEKVNIKPGS